MLLKLTTILFNHLHYSNGKNTTSYRLGMKLEQLTGKISSGEQSDDVMLKRLYPPDTNSIDRKTVIIIGNSDYYYYYYYYKCHVLQCCHHTVVGALYKNLDLKLLYSSMQMSADHRSRQCHISRMTDKKGETWSPSRMSKVRSRPESLVADCSTHALQPLERRGRQG